MKVLRLDKPARPASRLKVKNGSSATISQPNQNNDKAAAAGHSVGSLFKSHLFGGAATSNKNKTHQLYSDDQDHVTSPQNGGRRVRGPSSAPQMENTSNPSNASSNPSSSVRVRAPSIVAQVDPRTVNDSPSLSNGDVVIVGGLKARPDMNGCEGRISYYDTTSKRYNSLFDVSLLYASNTVYLFLSFLSFSFFQ